ncbi:hypothetical protein F4677DRAFT_448378 [Hypoxylon crocopeplum]|nr:hypothetical protein F4677DRAFT_448378 [Hypoxylon crocopeplum]
MPNEQTHPGSSEPRPYSQLDLKATTRKQVVAERLLSYLFPKARDSRLDDTQRSPEPSTTELTADKKIQLDQTTFLLEADHDDEDLWTTSVRSWDTSNGRSSTSNFHSNSLNQGTDNRLERTDGNEGPWCIINPGLHRKTEVSTLSHQDGDNAPRTSVERVQEATIPSIKKLDLRRAVYGQFLVWLAEHTYAQGGYGSGGGSGMQGGRQSDPQQAAVGSAYSGHKRKGKGKTSSSQEDYDDDDDDDDTSSMGRGKKPRYSDGSIDDGRKFGCPFGKKHPHLSPRCERRGFKDTSRVKEHIYRDHLVFQCTRCGITFSEDATWKQHQHSNPPCESVDHGPPQNAINQDQREMLRSRKGLKGLSESDRWLQIYKTVFPDAEPPYPSPYLESDSRNAIIQEFTNFARQEMPHLIDGEFDMFSNQPTILLDDTGRRAVHSMVTSVLSNLLDRFDGSRRPSTDFSPTLDHPEQINVLRDTVGDFDFDFTFSSEDLENPDHGDFQDVSEAVFNSSTQQSSPFEHILVPAMYDRNPHTQILSDSGYASYSAHSAHSDLASYYGCSFPSRGTEGSSPFELVIDPTKHDQELNPRTSLDSDYAPFSGYTFE